RFLGPRIGKQDEGTRDCRIGEPAQEWAGVVSVQADVGELVPFDRAQCLDDAVLEGLATDQPDARIGARLPQEMLGPAEAYLEPDLIDGRREQPARPCRRMLREVEANAGEFIGEQRRLPRARLAPAPTPIAAQVATVPLPVC